MENQNAVNLEVSRSLGRIEQKIDDLSVNVIETNKVLLKHDDKIDSLENQQAVINTKASILGAVGGAGIMLVWGFIKDKIKL